MHYVTQFILRSSECLHAMPAFSFLGQTVNHYRQKTVNEVRELVFKGAGVALVAAIIIWVAIFLYVAFYYTYIPSVSHVRPVHLQFR
jgi:seipin